MAAFLVDLFPTWIRYTSLSLPYHIRNGWMLLLFATAMVAASGDRGRSVCLNNSRAVVKWISALVMPPPGLASAG
jgi:hypothetical protein